MLAPNRDPYYHRPKRFEPLRDLIQRHLPPMAPGCLEFVGVTLWPIGFGDVEVRLEHDPLEGSFAITTVETLYFGSTEQCGTLIKDCELDAQTAAITAYDEQLTLSDNSPPTPITSGELLQAELDLACCDTYTLRYFMGLLTSVVAEPN